MSWRAHVARGVTGQSGLGLSDRSTRWRRVRLTATRVSNPVEEPMHFGSLLPAVAVAVATVAVPVSAQSIADRYRADANRIIEAALEDSTAYNRLAELTERFGSRLSGSQ